MYYPCSENKGADQLRGHREADLRLCFRIGKNPVFSRCGSYDLSYIEWDIKHKDSQPASLLCIIWLNLSVCILMKRKKKAN